MWTPSILPVFYCPSIFWTTSKRACSTWYVRLLRLQNGSDFVIPTQQDNHLFELGLGHSVPPAHQKVRTDNTILATISWCAEQTLLSNTTKLFMMRKTWVALPRKGPRPSGIFASSKFFTESVKLVVALVLCASSDRPSSDVRWEL